MKVLTQGCSCVYRVYESDPTPGILWQNDHVHVHSTWFSDSDSSETDTEELIRQEIARRKEEKQARLEAKKKAALAVEETLTNGHVGEKERVAEGEGVTEKETVTDIEGLENDTTGKTDTLLPQANETVGTETNGSEQVSHEELYSPQKSIMTMSPHRTMKVVPSRWTMLLVGYVMRME